MVLKERDNAEDHEIIYYREYSVVSMVFVMFIVDSILIARGILEPTGRLVDTRVIISVIGATTVQFGAIAVAISAWLFKRAASRAG